MGSSILLVVAAVIGAQLNGNPPAVDARRLVVSPPTTVAVIEATQLQGEPVRLSWSESGEHLYLRTSRSDRWGNTRDWHFVITAADGTLRQVDQEPGWSTVYCAWKSALSSPDAPQFRVDVEAREELKRPTNAGAGGALGQNASDPTGPGSELGPQGAAILAAATQGQRVTTVTLRLKGQVIGEFVNSMASLGLSYGWAPAGRHLAAAVDSKRRLFLVDEQGHRHPVTGTKNASLPAWSPDGRRIVYFERNGGKRYTLRSVAIAAR